jgi:subfamily B ATP-binding cassette protein MsbA
VAVHPPAKKKVTASAAWREAQELIWAHRKRLLLGLTLMLVSRVAGLVLPASSKWLIDEVVHNNRTDLLLPIALAVGAATLVQAVTSFVLSQILGVAAQRAITDMRKRVQARYAPAGALLRLDPDRHPRRAHHERRRGRAEPGRHRAGAAVGGMVTALFGLVALFYLNWSMTVITMVVLGAFGAGMAYAFRTLGPCSASAARSTRRSRAGSPSARRHSRRQVLYRGEA